MQINSSYPVICTSKIKESKKFYMENFEFNMTFESEWYISSKTKTKPKFELAFLDFKHSSLPAKYQIPTQGMLINFEVENVDLVYKNLVQKGIKPILDIKSEEWGQRHFIISDPNNLLIDVIQNIEPESNYQENYKAESK